MQICLFISTPFLLTVNPPGWGNSIFTNLSPITIPDVGSSTPFPSTIEVSGVPGTNADVKVTIHRMSHTYPGDVDMLLVGPAGQSAVLFSSTIGNNPMSDITFT